MTILTPEKRVELKRACAAVLRNNDIKPETATGKRMIHAYWCGALRALDAADDVSVVIYLTSGRYKDLVDFTDEQPKEN